MSLPRSLIARIERSTASLGKDQGRAVAPPLTPLSEPDHHAEEVASLVQEGSRALQRRDFDGAARFFRDALLLDPAARDARTAYALAEVAAGRDERALGVVLDGLNRDPHDAALHEILGDLHDRGERVDDALREWTEAFRLAPNDRLRDKILKAGRELNAGRDYAFAATAHFNLRHDGELDRDLADAVEEFLEEQYRQLATRFRHSPSQPITVLLYPNRAFRDVTQAPDPVRGIYDGKIRVPLGGLRKLDPSSRAVLVHELTHAFVHSKTRGNAPRWLQEGLAQRIEGRSVPASVRAKVLELLRSPSGRTWEQSDLLYPASLLLIHHLEQRHGFDGLVALVARLGDGASVDDALRELFAADSPRLLADWTEWLAAGGDPR